MLSGGLVCGLAQSSAPDFAALRSLWIADLEGKRLEPALACYAPGAVFTNADGTHVSGEGLRELYKSVFRNFDASIEMTPRTTTASGELAYEAGSYAEEIVDRATHAGQHLSGDYLTVYRRESGRWLIVEQVWTLVPPTK